MIKPEIPAYEKERLKELKSYNILDTLSEADYNNLTAIASQICGTPIALISLVDDKRQWFKSHHGLDATETPKEYAFCAHAINYPNKDFIIEDAREDERFHDNPLVVGDPEVIFYAGIPLKGENDLPLGTLCVIDHKPRQLNDQQKKSLRALSEQVMNLMKLRKKQNQLEKALSELNGKNKELQNFAHITAHDLKSPLNTISNLIHIVRTDHSNQIPPDGLAILEMVQSSSDHLKGLINSLLEYSKNVHSVKQEKTTVNLLALKNTLEELVTSRVNCSITLKSPLEEIQTNATALEQILINLTSNAIKYNEKDEIKIEIGAVETGTHFQFYVKDNGPGIETSKHEEIFEIFKTLTAIDRFGEKGNGIGLATVKKVVEALGGTIHLESSPGKGATFHFTLEK